MLYQRFSKSCNVTDTIRSSDIVDLYDVPTPAHKLESPGASWPQHEIDQLRRKTPSGITQDGYQSDLSQPSRPPRLAIITPSRGGEHISQLGPNSPTSADRDALTNPTPAPRPITNTLIASYADHRYGDAAQSPLLRQLVAINGAYPARYDSDTIAKHDRVDDVFETAQRLYDELQAHRLVQTWQQEMIERANGTAAATHAYALRQQQISKVLQKLISTSSKSGWQSASAANLAGFLAHNLGRPDGAIMFYNLALTINPSHADANDNLACALFALNKPEEAVCIWRTLLEGRTVRYRAAIHLVEVLCAAHRYEEGVAVVQTIEDRIARRSSEGQPTAGRVDMWPSLSHDGSIHSQPGSSWHDDPDVLPALYRNDSLDLLAAKVYMDSLHLLLLQGKARLLHLMGRITEALSTFEAAIMAIAPPAIRTLDDVRRHIIEAISSNPAVDDSVLLSPEQALLTNQICFPPNGLLCNLPLHDPVTTYTKQAVRAATSNALLSIAKIFQDGRSCDVCSVSGARITFDVQGQLAFYYLSLSLQPTPSTINNIGVLMTSVVRSVPAHPRLRPVQLRQHHVAGVAPGSGPAFALQFYKYGLQLDDRHAHIYTNYGSLLKELGQLDAAIAMYRTAVDCDRKFDVALTNLANALKDRGHLREAMAYYLAAAEVNPTYPEAISGLANAFSSVCNWHGRGGLYNVGRTDRYHVDEAGRLVDSAHTRTPTVGWITRLVSMLRQQLCHRESWGQGCSMSPEFRRTLHGVGSSLRDLSSSTVETDLLRPDVNVSVGSRILRLCEVLNHHTRRRWYHDKLATTEHVVHAPSHSLDLFASPGEKSTQQALQAEASAATSATGGSKSRAFDYARLQPSVKLPKLALPPVLPFHAFTMPLDAELVRQISQSSSERLAITAAQAPWLPRHVYPPPDPPSPVLRVGYISSDFRNHPLAHLMQSVFGLHDRSRVECFCYATTASDGSIYRAGIKSGASEFVDVSSCSVEQIVQLIVEDGIHILVNLNGYTRGATNEVFAARPAPVQISMMGFAGPIGADWSDYLLADDTAVPRTMLRPQRDNTGFDVIRGETDDQPDNWVYSENIIFCRHSFFVCDHKQSAADAQRPRLSWNKEQHHRWNLRKQLFPDLADTTVIYANFNQLYKIDPTTFHTWLRILARVPNSILWLLRFPDLGEPYLKQFARSWAGEEVASRIIFTNVAAKDEHILRAKVADLFLDTPECNAHTTAADVLWSGTPILTYPRHEYKMCARVAASILKSALPAEPVAEREAAIRDLIASSEEEYEELAVKLGCGLRYTWSKEQGKGRSVNGRLSELRTMLLSARWTSALFDTRRWVRDVEDAYAEAWRKWVAGEGGDIYVADLARA